MMNAAFCISGGASTARRIIDECRAGVLKGLVNPVLVITSKPCRGIENCLAGGMKPKDVLTFRRKDYCSPEVHARAILQACWNRGVDFIGQYGYNALMHSIVIEAYPGMMVNQHPGPTDPPREDFGGKGMMGDVVHECILRFAKVTGWGFGETEATAHRVTPEYDEGARVGFRTLQLRTDHTPQSLAAELLPLEHELQVEVIGQFASGTVTEFSRQIPLVKPSLVPALQEIKRVAIAAHQRGARH